MDGELELTYPCSWTYKVVGLDEEALRRAVAEIVLDLEHTLEFSHRSSGGKYVSLHLEATVESDEQRRGIGTALHEHAAVRFVL